MQRWRVRFVAALVAVLGIVFSVATTGTPASAADGCYGDYCSGRNPATTGVGGVPCVNDGYPVARSDIKNNAGQIGPIIIGGDKIGEVRLMWSPRCQANWGELNIGQGGNFRHLVVRQSGGYEQVNELLRVGQYWLNAGVYRTNMIYSPTRAAMAEVNTPPWWVSTTWV